MIDTERADVELKMSLNRIRYYLRKLEKAAAEDNLLPIEQNLAASFNWNLEIITNEARKTLHLTRK